MGKLVSSIAVVVLGSIGMAAAQPAGGPPGMTAPLPSGPMGGPPMPAQPMAPMAPAPPGTRATFISTGETRFDVRIDDSAVCTTPCSIFVEPLRFVTLHSHEARPTRLPVGYMPVGD